MANNSKVRYIHVNRKAVEGKIYIENGTRYVGLADGSLAVEQLLEGDVQGTTLNNKVEVIGEYTVEELTGIIQGLLNDTTDINVNTFSFVDVNNDQFIHLLESQNSKLDIIIELLKNIAE